MNNGNRINDDFYVVGGSMRPDAPSYVERNADNELYERILAGEFCYVLTPRQMGKSSLMARTAERLKREGFCTAIVDLTKTGTEKEEKSADRWYYGIAYRIVRELGTKIKLSHWWEEREKLPALQRLTEFFSDVVLESTDKKVVIFVDEIDTTINLPFTDDFFAAIRACYNARAHEPAYQRLSFVLLGVATPSQLIKDTSRTPFNIGSRIELTDFTFSEARPLAHFPNMEEKQREEVLKRILYWSGGHPYLTQKLCRIAALEKWETYNEKAVDGLVEKHFLSAGAHLQDFNLDFVRNRLVRDKKILRKLLKLYRGILKGRSVPDEPLSAVHSTLKLSGVAVPRENRHLRVRNLIYERIFTTRWVKDVMPVDWNRNIAVASIAVLILGFAVWYILFLPREYIDAIRRAENDVPNPAYEKLKRMPGFAGKADTLLAEYWDRRVLGEEVLEERDNSLLSRLKALQVKDTESRRRELNQLVGNDYKNLIHTYRLHTSVQAAAFRPDGKAVLTGGSDGTARLWSVDTGQPIGKPIEIGDWVTAVAFSPDSKTLLTGSEDGTAQLWSAKTGQFIGKPMKHGGWITAVAISSDGKTVLTGSNDGIARLWNVETRQPIGNPMKLGVRVTAVAISPDGKTVFTGGYDGTARLWSAKTGQFIGKPMKHGGWITAVAFSPDGKTLFTGCKDGTARLWSAETSQPIGNPIVHGDRVYAVAFSPDGNTLFTGGLDGTARLWSAETGEPIGKPMKHVEWVTAVAFSPDGKSLLTGSWDGTVRLWSLDTGKPMEADIKLDDSIYVAAISPDGKTLLTGSRDGTARLWNVENGQPIGNTMELGGWVYAVAFSPDGKTMLTGSTDDTAQLWNAETGKPIGNPMKLGSNIDAVAFSPDGKTVLSGGYDGMVRLWSVETGEHIGNPMEHENSVTAAAFSPDGKTLLTGGYDGTARLWSAETGEPIGNPMKHGDRVFPVAFSPDGKTVFTGCKDRTARLWSAETGEPIGKPIKHGGWVRAVVFSPDGKTITVFTEWWIHQSTLAGKTMTPKASRLLPGPFSRGYRFLDEKGDKIQVAVKVTDDSIKLITVSFDIPEAPPIQGEPAKLLDEWQKKLGLKLNEDGTIVRKYPVE